MEYKGWTLTTRNDIKYPIAAAKDGVVLVDSSLTVMKRKIDKAQTALLTSDDYRRGRRDGEQAALVTIMAILDRTGAVVVSRERMKRLRGGVERTEQSCSDNILFRYVPRGAK